MAEIVIPYTPRPLQAELHRKLTEHRWSVVVCHRRWGKTVAAINHLLRDAILCQRKSPRLHYIAPTNRMAKQVAWDYVHQFAGDIPAVKFNETELRCDLPNGARLTLLGGEDPSRLRGIYSDGIVIDETADMPESVFPEVLRPALADRGGYAIFIGTPRGHNAFFDYWQL
ncbi:MAG: terminase family protein, partial [Candidatus Thermoplasmatota archaeon]|nr:terminase family protein [Candidatus Thermoplasmatota archaeon]